MKNVSGKWECVIGLEVHAQIASKSKIFSSASTKFGALPNSQVKLLDAGMPGMLPVLNEYCVHQAIKTGLGLNASINKLSVFDRKNYFYPDLPQGYQISQFYQPIVQNGHLKIYDKNGDEKNIRINRIHLEQDAGKSIHDQHESYTLIDLNRSGIALIEIVTEPDIRSSYQAVEYIKKLRTLMRYIGSCDGNMDQGSLRCDANVSVRRIGGELGTRCEIKNLNSTKNIAKAIEYEISRQIEILESGGEIIQETRLFDISTLSTRAMRGKEGSADYRYFPDPDLLPVKVDEKLIEDLKKELPELPDAKLSRYIALGLTAYNANIIVLDERVAQFFEEAIKYADAKIVANWICIELFGLLNKNSIKIGDCKITPKDLSHLVNLVQDGIISNKIAKSVFEDMFKTGINPKELITKKGLTQISDIDELSSIIEDVLLKNKDSVDSYKNGKDKLFGFFVGQVMKKTSGQGNPQIVNQILKSKLSKDNFRK